MPENTEQIQKKDNATRAWVERNLGKVFFASLPVLIGSLAIWISSIEVDINEIKTHSKTNEEQWTSIYTNNEKIQTSRRELEEELKEIEIEVRAYQLMFSLILSQNKELTKDITSKTSAGIIDKEKRRLTDKDLEKIVKELEKKKVITPAKPKIINPIPFNKRVEQFKRQQIQQRPPQLK